MAMSHMVTLQSNGEWPCQLWLHYSIIGVAVLHMVTLQGNGNGCVVYGYITGS